MKTRGLLATIALGLWLGTPALYAKPAHGKRIHPMRRPVRVIAPGDVDAQMPFAMLSPKPSMRGHAGPSGIGLTGSSIAAIADGALVIDGETGTLSLLNGEAALVDTAQVGSVAGLLTVSEADRRVYIACRNGDRIAIYRYGETLETVAAIKTAAEPYGVALTPDGKTLLVTTVAGRRLQGFSTESLEERWSLELGPEARAVAVSPDGKEAVVSFLGTAAIARLALRADHGRPGLRFQALHASQSVTDPDSAALPQSERVPERFARNAFAATFVGDTAVVAYQQSTPLAARTDHQETRGVYGGSSQGNPPVLHRLAFLPRAWSAAGLAHVRVQMPRALTYSPASDTLYLADMANDLIYGLQKSSSPSIHNPIHWTVRHENRACGPDGVAVAANGDLFVNCSFDKRVVRVRVGHELAPSLAWSPPLSRTRLSPAAERGRSLFHKGSDPRLSSNGAMSCGNCHPEARSDGLSWRIDGTDLQTPLLAGRMVGTHPFKWDGQDKDLHTSLMHTVVRLGGTGIAPADASDLQAFLESLPAVRVGKHRPGSAALAREQAAAGRGKALFASAALGCRSCHAGKNYSDGQSYEFTDDIVRVNTPSLLGLAASAPYYHDGSAATLRALILENGSVHGMGRMDTLEPAEVDDLIAYLETL